MSLRNRLRSSAVLSGMTLLSRLLGFVRVKLIALYFGTSLSADILNFVFNIPNNLRKLLAEGALNTLFMPEFIAEKEKSFSAGERFFRVFLTWQVLLLLFILALALIFAWPLMAFLSSYQGDALDLTVRLFRWTILYIFFVSLSAVLMSIFNAHQHFFLPSLTPLLFSIFVIGSLFFFAQTWGVYAMALGVLLGGGVPLFIQFIFLRSLGYVYRPLFDPQSVALRRALWKAVPIFMSALIPVFNQQIVFSLATQLPEGQTTILSSALVYWQLPFGLFYASIATVYFPRFAQAHSSGQREQLIKDFNQALGLLALTLIPAAVFMYLTAPYYLTQLLQGGAFGSEATSLTSDVLRLYLWSLFPAATYNYVLRFFYALHLVKPALWLSLFVYTLDILVAFYFLDSWYVLAFPLASLLVFSLGTFCALSFIAFKGYQLHLMFLGRIFLSIVLSLLFPLMAYFMWFEALFVMQSSFWFVMSLLLAYFIFFCSSILVVYYFSGFSLYGILRPYGKQRGSRS